MSLLGRFRNANSNVMFEYLYLQASDCFLKTQMKGSNFETSKEKMRNARKMIKTIPKEDFHRGSNHGSLDGLSVCKHKWSTLKGVRVQLLLST